MSRARAAIALIGTDHARQTLEEYNRRSPGMPPHKKSTTAAVVTQLTGGTCGANAPNAPPAAETIHSPRKHNNAARIGDASPVRLPHRTFPMLDTVFIRSRTTLRLTQRTCSSIATAVGDDCPRGAPTDAIAGAMGAHREPRPEREAPSAPAAPGELPAVRMATFRATRDVMVTMPQRVRPGRRSKLPGDPRWSDRDGDRKGAATDAATAADRGCATGRGRGEKGGGPEWVSGGLGEARSIRGPPQLESRLQ